MSQFPIDILSDILLRLPAKSLLRFKNVCKLWYDLINDPYFINCHVQKSNLHMIFMTPVVYLSDFDTFDNPTPLNYPFKDLKYGGSQVFGSSRGLLCFSMYSYPYTTFLYNPTTQSYKTLPFLPQLSTFDYPKGHFYLAFSYDHVSDDYKVVKIFMRGSDNEGDSFKSHVMVYSLKSDCWRRGAHDVPYYFYCHRSHQAVVNGIFHWSIEGDHRVPLPIVGFNFSDESFSSVPLPNYRMDSYIRAHLGVLDSSLCMMVNYRWDCDVWLMKEYGVAASWTRLYTFRKFDDLEEMRPLCFSKCRKKLFVIYFLANIASLDLETMELTVIELPGFYKLFDAHVCVENLLMFKDTEDVHEGAQEVRSRNTKRKLLMRKTERLLRFHDASVRVLVEDIRSSNRDS